MDDGDEETNWDGIDRRDANVTLMRLNSVESGLNQHINHCARLQKGVLITALTTLGWVVTHSPEFAGTLGKFIGALAK